MCAARGSWVGRTYGVRRPVASASPAGVLGQEARRRSGTASVARVSLVLSPSHAPKLWTRSCALRSVSERRCTTLATRQAITYRVIAHEAAVLIKQTEVKSNLLRL